MTHQGHQPSFTIDEIARSLNGAGIDAAAQGDGSRRITSLRTIDQSTKDSLTFVRSETYLKAFAGSAAAAALVPDELNASAPKGKSIIAVPDADLALAVVLDMFAPPADNAPPGIHHTAVIDPDADVSLDASVGPGCVIGAGAVISEGASLGPHCVIGRDARIGKGTSLRAHVTVLGRCSIGASCILHPGVVIGADGFGYRFDPKQGHVKIPHIGAVTIGDRVEIGANTCIDRGKFGDTTVGTGAKIDNLTQIGHNCEIGDLVVICGQVGLAGSVTVGAGSVLAGQVGVGDNITIAPRTRVGGQSGVTADIGPGDVFGTPATEGREGKRNYAALRNLGELARRVKALEHEIGLEPPHVKKQRHRDKSGE